mmetsp:Transcript_2857/g.6574  ORF Transcript_2857/g.6574 Transcript_2857/m.6574 type:complete len:653 (-) Transcript_2857:75-2033(-)
MFPPRAQVPGSAGSLQFRPPQLNFFQAPGLTASRQMMENSTGGSQLMNGTAGSRDLSQSRLKLAYNFRVGNLGGTASPLSYTGPKGYYRQPSPNAEGVNATHPQEVAATSGQLPQAHPSTSSQQHSSRRFPVPGSTTMSSSSTSALQQQQQYPPNSKGPGGQVGHFPSRGMSRSPDGSTTAENNGVAYHSTRGGHGPAGKLLVGTTAHASGSTSTRRANDFGPPGGGAQQQYGAQYNGANLADASITINSTVQTARGEHSYSQHTLHTGGSQGHPQHHNKNPSKPLTTHTGNHLEEEALLREQAHNLRREISELATEHEELETKRIPILDEEIRKLSQKKKVVEEEEQQVKEQYELQSEKHERFLRRHKDVTREMKELEIENERKMVEEKQRLEDEEIKPARERREKLLVEEAELKEELKIQTKEWRTKIEHHQGIYNEHLRNKNALYKSLEDTYNGIKQKVTQTDKQYQELKLEASKLNQEKQTLEQETQAVIQQTKQARADIDKYQLETKQSEARFFDAQKSISRNTDKLEQIGATQARIEESLAQIDQEAAKAETIFDESRVKLEEVEAEVEDLRGIMAKIREWRDKIVEVRLKKEDFQQDAVRMADHGVTPEEMLQSVGTLQRRVFAQECQRQAERVLLTYHEDMMAA